MFTAGRILRSANRSNLHRPSCSSPSGGQSLGEASDKVHLHLYRLPSANYHVYRQQQLELEKERRSQDKSQQQQQQKQQPFYVPFIWQALVATVTGIIIICVGITLCILGYEAENRSAQRNSMRHSDELLNLRISTQRVNKTRKNLLPSLPTGNDANPEPEASEATFPAKSSAAGTTTDDSPTDDGHVTSDNSRLKYLIYIGPVVMSCGSFAIVFSCVVVCETRDRVLELLERRQRQLETMATSNRQELLKSLEEHLLSSTVSLDGRSSPAAAESNNDKDKDKGGDLDRRRRSSFQAMHGLKIDVFTKSLIRSQLRNKLAAIVDAKLQT